MTEAVKLPANAAAKYSFVWGFSDQHGGAVAKTLTWNRRDSDDARRGSVSDTTPSPSTGSDP